MLYDGQSMRSNSKIGIKKTCVILFLSKLE